MKLYSIERNNNVLHDPYNLKNMQIYLYFHSNNIKRSLSPKYLNLRKKGDKL